jgi:3-oxoacyl-[acyl-carrier-protein] synthase-3
VPHSANLRLDDALRERLGFDEAKMLTSVEQYGNTSSSSIPLAISLALKDGRIKRGDKVLIYGFGGGITYAGAIIEW